MPLVTLVVLMALTGGLAVALFPGRAGAFLQGVAVKWWQFLVGFIFGVVSITAVGGWSPFLLMVFFMLAGAFGTCLAMWVLRTTTRGRRLAAILLVVPTERSLPAVPVNETADKAEVA